MPPTCSGERTPSSTSRPPSSCWLCARITSSPRPFRLAAARLTSPRSELSAAPPGAVIRIATSLPAGSHSASSTCRGQSAPKTRLAVVTPGEPFALAIATSAINWPRRSARRRAWCPAPASPAPGSWPRPRPPPRWTLSVGISTVTFSVLFALVFGSVIAPALDGHLGRADQRHRGRAVLVGGRDPDHRDDVADARVRPTARGRFQADTDQGAAAPGSACSPSLVKLSGVTNWSLYSQVVV